MPDDKPRLIGILVELSESLDFGKMYDYRDTLRRETGLQFRATSGATYRVCVHNRDGIPPKAKEYLDGLIGTEGIKNVEISETNEVK